MWWSDSTPSRTLPDVSCSHISPLSHHCHSLSFSAASSDFQSVTELLTFNGDMRSHQVVVSVTDDSVNEPREQFSAGLEILTPGVGDTIHLIPDSTTISISDDDGQ